MKAIGYVRVSTEEQVQGNGLAVQRQGIAKFCKAEGTAPVGAGHGVGKAGGRRGRLSGRVPT